GDPSSSQTPRAVAPAFIRAFKLRLSLSIQPHPRTLEGQGESPRSRSCGQRRPRVNFKSIEQFQASKSDPFAPGLRRAALEFTAPEAIQGIAPSALRDEKQVDGRPKQRELGPGPPLVPEDPMEVGGDRKNDEGAKRRKPREKSQKQEQSAKEFGDGQSDRPEGGRMETTIRQQLALPQRVDDLGPAVHHQGDTGDHPQDRLTDRLQEAVKA